MMHKLPKVSVVIPMYNVAQYINEALDSVLAQTFTDFEVICVDDGSPDNAVALVCEYDDPRITVLRQKNRGLSGARNSGIAAARGQYVALLDADDRWDPNKLQAHVEHLDANPAIGVSYCPSLFMDDEGELMGIGQFPKLTDITQKHVFCRNPVGNGSAPVLRKATFDAIAFERDGRTMYFDENLRQSEDIECWTRISLDTDWGFEGIEGAYTHYRVNMGGLSANLDKQLESWKNAMQHLRAKHEGFFAKHYQLALAYQYRYLTRRAIQSGNRLGALLNFKRALQCSPKIFTEEPARSINTLGCMCLSLLPRPVYCGIERGAMRLSAALR